MTETGEEIDKQYSDIEFVSARYWNSYLEDETIKMHSKDSTSYGARDTSHKTARQVYNLGNSLLSASVEQNDTLALHWNYINQASGSDSFIINDFSSGSVDAASKDYISEFSKYQQTGKAEFFNSLEPSKKKYTTSAVLKDYENITSEDLISIINEYDDIYETEKKIVNHYFVLEKSMFSVISKEMINWLGSVKEFNNIIGTPSDRYKENYSHLRYLRTLFFGNVENEPDYDRYVQFYKWIDDSIFFLVKQLIPVSTNYDPGVANIVESHVFERNKYKHKFPTLEFIGDTPNTSFRATGELLYPWSVGHAPISGLENKNCLWWNVRAEREGILSSDRSGIFAAIKSQTDRKFSAPYVLTFEKVPRTNVRPYPSSAEIRGVILTKKRVHDIIINEVGFDVTGLNGLEIPDLIPPREDCED